MKILWLSSLLIVNTLIAFLLGWIANWAWTRSHRKQDMATHALDSSARRCRELLAAIWEDLGVFDEALRQFDASRHVKPECCEAPGLPASKRLRVACQHYTSVIEHRQQELQEYRECCGEVTVPLCERIGESLRRAVELDAHLSELESLLSSTFQATLDEMTTEVLEENRRLQADLALARRRIAGQEEQLAAAERDARIDHLTGLPNRRAFDEKLTELLAFWARFQQPFVLAVIDIDHFKALNDEYGHRAGDSMLQTVARVMESNKRRTDHVSRYGGEEFAMLMPNCSLDRAEAVMERLGKSIASGVLIHEGARLAVTVSAGLAAVREEETAEQLIDHADSALRRAKLGGRDQVCCHTGDELPVGSLPPVEECSPAGA